MTSASSSARESTGSRLPQKLAWTARKAIGWDALVLATGARPRRLPGLSGAGVHVLRTLADARSLRAQLIPGRRLVIAGAGFIGTEVASTALALGLEVTLVDKGRLPFERTLGTEVGRLLAHRYRAHGVDLRRETLVTRLRRDGAGALRAVALSDGAELACDLLLVAAGAEPAGELLGTAGGYRHRRGGADGAPRRLRLRRRRRPLASSARPSPPARALVERRPPGRHRRPRDPRARDDELRRARTSGPTSSGSDSSTWAFRQAGHASISTLEQTRSKRTTVPPTTVSSPHCS